MHIYLRMCIFFCTFAPSRVYVACVRAYFVLLSIDIALCVERHTNKLCAKNVKNVKKKIIELQYTWKR